MWSVLFSDLCAVVLVLLSKYWEDVHKAFMSVLHCVIMQPLTQSYTKTEFYLGSEQQLAAICPAGLKLTQPDIS